MKRVSNVFWQQRAVAVRIENGDFYLLGVRVDSKDHVLKNPTPLDRSDMIVPDSNGYLPYLLDIANENGADKYPANKNNLIKIVRCYARNGYSDEDDRDIFVLEDDELAALIDALRDGDYMFVL